MIKNQKVLETILVLVLALVILYWRFGNTSFLAAAVIIGLIGLFIPYLAAKIHWLWMGTGNLLGFVTSRILLLLIFFIILFPLSVLSKLARRNSLRLKPGGTTYFKERNHLHMQKDLEKMW